MIGKDAVDAMDPPKAEKEVQGGGQGAAGAGGSGGGDNAPPKSGGFDINNPKYW